MSTVAVCSLAFDGKTEELVAHIKAHPKDVNRKDEVRGFGGGGREGGRKKEVEVCGGSGKGEGVWGIVRRSAGVAAKEKDD